MKSQNLSQFSNFRILLLITTVSIYFLGFNFKEYVPGGSPSDFNSFIWKNINFFKNDFIYSLLNYKKLSDANFPGFYIINYINPFSNSVETFHLFSLTIGFLTFVIFGITLSHKDKSNDKITNFLTASLILILPFFISRVYWGTSAGLAWFFFILTIFLFCKIQDEFSSNKSIKLRNILILCFLSSILLYIRSSFIFLIFFFLLFFLFKIKRKKYFFSLSFFYTLLSIPGFSIIYIWLKQPDLGITAIQFLEFKNIFLNFPIYTSYIAFYIFPILLIGLKNIKKDITLKYLKIFFIISIIYLILIYFGKLDYLSKYDFGGGAILKLNYMLKDGNYFLLLFFSTLGCCILMNFLERDFFQNCFLIIPLFIVYGLTGFPYQDYFEPLIIFLFFSGLFRSSLYDLFIEEKSKICVLYFFYFLTFLSASIAVKNFI